MFCVTGEETGDYAAHVYEQRCTNSANIFLGKGGGGGLISSYQ